MGASRVTWLLERVNELASGEVMCLSRATLDSAGSIAQDFAMIRPILDTLLLSPVVSPPRSEGFSRALSAPLQETAATELDDETAVVKETKPLQSARFNGYIKAGIDHVEAFALLSNKDAADFFDLVLQGVRRGVESRTAAELFVKEMWYSGLCLDLKNLRMAPKLLARLARYVSNKQDVRKVASQLLPDLCQGVSLDTSLQRIIQCKVEMRKAMLSGYMQALDESEGLQQTISRLADRMGVEPSDLRSDTGLKIPSHVRGYLQKLETYTRERKRLSELEMQIVVLRALGAEDPSDTVFTFDASRPMLPRILEQLREDTEENVAPNRRPLVPAGPGLAKRTTFSGCFGPDRRPSQPTQMRATADV